MPVNLLFYGYSSLWSFNSIETEWITSLNLQIKMSQLLRLHLRSTGAVVQYLENKADGRNKLGGALHLSVRLLFGNRSSVAILMMHA